MTDKLFEIQDVTFLDTIKYPQITIHTKGTTFIAGESGCGKSTLLKMLNGTVTPSAGDIYYKGLNIAVMDTIELRRKVLLVAQSLYLFDGTIADNFRIYHEYRGIEVPSEAEMREYLSVCEIPFSLTQETTLMSGGERQRIFLAICLSFLPEVLLLDEPTSALDEKTSYQLMQNIKDFCRRKGIELLVISHDSQLTREFADRVVTLEKK